MKIFKKFFPGAPIRQITIGCIIDGKSYTCKLDNGENCGLLCEIEHGEYIYADEEDEIKIIIEKI